MLPFDVAVCQTLAEVLDIYSSKTKLVGIVAKIYCLPDFYEWQQQLGGYMRESSR